MGSRGPVPKRSDQRRRANRDGSEVVAAAGPRVKPPSASKHWHRLAREWFRSLQESGQAQFYEASDWAQAKVVAELMSRELEKDRPSAQMVQTLLGQATELLTTEGSRRRVRLELERGEAPVEDEAVAILDDYRQSV